MSVKKFSPLNENDPSKDLDDSKITSEGLKSLIDDSLFIIEKYYKNLNENSDLLHQLEKNFITMENNYLDLCMAYYNKDKKKNHNDKENKESFSSLDKGNLEIIFHNIEFILEKEKSVSHLK